MYIKGNFVDKCTSYLCDCRLEHAYVYIHTKRIVGFYCENKYLRMTIFFQKKYFVIFEYCIYPQQELKIDI